jgi:hypothetical protein
MLSFSVLVVISDYITLLVFFDVDTCALFTSYCYKRKLVPVVINRDALYPL